MGVNSTIPTSRRGYLSQSELAQFANITITDSVEADDVISQAEEMIDAFVGYQCPFIEEPIEHVAMSGGSTSLTLNTTHQNIHERDYFKGCMVEIISGTGEGERKRITASTKAGVLTVDSAWTTTPDSTSFYRITQLGKFPRMQDVKNYYNNNNVIVVVKIIPEAIKRAVAAQVEYIINMGDEFFRTDKSGMQSESIGDYSYSLQAGTPGSARMIAPRAKLLLRGYTNRTGRIIA